jgi:hypothetical protein
VLAELIEAVIQLLPPGGGMPPQVEHPAVHEADAQPGELPKPGGGLTQQIPGRCRRPTRRPPHQSLEGVIVEQLGLHVHQADLEALREVEEGAPVLPGPGDRGGGLGGR